MKGKILVWSTGFALIFALAVAIWIVRGPHAPASGSVAGFKVTSGAVTPDFTFLDPDDHPTSLAAQRGSLMLVNLWATWCTPCVEEMPSLERLAALRDGPGFKVVTVSEDGHKREQVMKFMEEHHLDHLPRNLDAEMAATGTLGIVGLPTTLLIAADGRELGRLEGPAAWDSSEALALIDWYAQHEDGK